MSVLTTMCTLWLQVVYQVLEILHCFTDKGLLHPKIDLSTTVMMAAGNSFQFAVLPSPLLQPIVDNSGTSLSPVTLAGRSSVGSGPQKRNGMASCCGLGAVLSHVGMASCCGLGAVQFCHYYRHDSISAALPGLQGRGCAPRWLHGLAHCIVVLWPMHPA